MVGGRSMGDGTDLKEDVIKRACHLAMKAHKSSTGKQYACKSSSSSSEAIFAFAGSWSCNEWFTSGKPFGETKMDLARFPCLKSIGTDETGLVNQAFLGRFEEILKKNSFQIEVEKAVKDKKQLVFTGHSSGGPLAILATLWFLEQHTRKNSNISPRCLTFGSPLSGDRIFTHALSRENWARYFFHFVMRYDVVPRIMLAPFSSVEQAFQRVLEFFNPKSPIFLHESISKSNEAITLFVTVMRNASCLASHAACNIMGCTNSLLETVPSFIKLSPYRPFGTFIFCTGNGKLVVVKNPDAVLQMLFYSCQLSNAAEAAQVAHRSLNEHLVYENELQECLVMQNVVYLDQLEGVPLSSNISELNEVAEINSALNDLGMSARGRLCLRAAGELVKQKEKNQEKIDSNKNNIRKGLSMIQEYKASCKLRKAGYYDAFKLQKDIEDFNANVKRVELAGIWDEIIEMLKKYELPDGFEGQKEWIELGTEYRRLVEPLDIANYYRYLKNEDTGSYLDMGRPKRYRFTQRWREHAERMEAGSISESSFLAEVEELRSISNKRSFEDMKDRILKLERQVLNWFQSNMIGEDVFLKGCTFADWWKTLPDQHKLQSCIREHFA
ncbi:hypothetical protein RJ640_005312 [Escallonia rubra]|uniref:Protein EDS1L-like n=1 Tax=Escallonia rubra TaxID=112253 RepID=A0AA88Q7R4_9ASTE|nr:hypothetical protein RJ640_005312 [Escallonia rubra]